MNQNFGINEAVINHFPLSFIKGLYCLEMQGTTDEEDHAGGNTQCHVIVKLHGQLAFNL